MKDKFKDTERKIQQGNIDVKKQNPEIQKIINQMFLKRIAEHMHTCTCTHPIILEIYYKITWADKTKQRNKFQGQRTN